MKPHTHGACCHIRNFMRGTGQALRQAEGCFKRAREGYGMALCFEGELD